MTGKKKNAKKQQEIVKTNLTFEQLMKKAFNSFAKERKKQKEMIKEQVEKFMEYFKENNPLLFNRLEGIVVFVKTNKSDKLSLLFWPAPNKPYISKQEEIDFGNILTSFKKEYKIYSEVPTIEDDFIDFLRQENSGLLMKLEEVIIENTNGNYLFKFIEKEDLSKIEKDILRSLWDKFLKSLKFISIDNQ